MASLVGCKVKQPSESKDSPREISEVNVSLCFERISILFSRAATVEGAACADCAPKLDGEAEVALSCGTGGEVGCGKESHEVSEVPFALEKLTCR